MAERQEHEPETAHAAPEPAPQAPVPDLARATARLAAAGPAPPALPPDPDLVLDMQRTAGNQKTTRWLQERDD